MGPAKTECGIGLVANAAEHHTQGVECCRILRPERQGLEGRRQGRCLAIQPDQGPGQVRAPGGVARVDRQGALEEVDRRAESALIGRHPGQEGVGLRRARIGLQRLPAKPLRLTRLALEIEARLALEIEAPGSGDQGCGLCGHGLGLAVPGPNEKGDGPNEKGGGVSSAAPIRSLR